MDKMYVGVSAVVEHDGLFLILKRSPNKDFQPNHWETVTGRVEVGESPAEAAVREAREETGLDVVVVIPLATGFFYRGGPEFPMAYVSFWCKATTTEVITSPEHVKHKWLTADEALAEPTLNHFHEMFRRVRQLQLHLPPDFCLGG